MRQIINIIVVWLVLSSILFAGDYRFVRIDFPDAKSTQASTINARGDIVGNYNDLNGVGHGFLLRKGVFSTIDFSNASFTAVRSINARGDVSESGLPSFALWLLRRGPSFRRSALFATTSHLFLEFQEPRT